MGLASVFNINERKGKAVWLFIVLLIGTVVVYYFFFERRSGNTEYITAQVTSGTIINKVAATGTMQAVTTVTVGSQASGTISAIYVDFNSVVHKGEVIAELDPASLQAQVQQAQANVEQSQASYKVAEANLSNAKAQLSAAKSNVLNQRAGVSSAEGNLNSLKAQADDALSLYKKDQTLFKEGIIAQRDLEVADTGYKSAQAKYEQAAAQVNQAQVTEQSAQSSGIEQAQASVQQMQSQLSLVDAQIKQAKAALNLANINLSHTTITSPINGVVVSRQVDVGQTVAASLSAPVLFTIANDLTQMQVIANIDEADIGAVNQANKVNFTVDAFPEQSFAGTINQIRLNAQTVQNVVTYNVVINVDNPDQKLKPGMTANLTFIIAEKDNVIKIPNAALRFTPEHRQEGGVGGNSNARRGANGARGNANLAANIQDNVAENSAESGNSNSGDGAQVALPTAPVLPGQTRIVWTLDENKRPRPHRVKIGISDGTSTEMVEGDLAENEAVITGENSGSAPAAGARPGGAGGAPGFGGAGGRAPGGGR